MGSSDCFSKIIAYIFPPWHCVNAHLNAAYLQWENFCFIEVFTLDDDKLIKCILINSAWLQLTLLTPVGAVRVYLVFTKRSVFGLVFVK